MPEPATEAFSVDVPVFSGPFRVLADLILGHKLDVCDVPVATVTDRFLQQGKEAGGWPLDEATWFLATAAILLELKVGRLMPRPEQVTEEDLLSGGSPDLAYARSLELRAFRRVASELSDRLAAGALFHSREAGPPEEFAHLYPDVLERVGPQDLAGAAAGLMRQPVVDLSHVAPIRVTVSDAIRAVQEQLAGRGATAFRDLVADCSERIHVVVRFLALLELHRDGKIELSQSSTFGDIEVRLKETP